MSQEPEDRELPSSATAVRRLINLTLALMATATPMTVADIIRRVEGYTGDPGDESDRRKFERYRAHVRLRPQSLHERGER